MGKRDTKKGGYDDKIYVHYGSPYFDITRFKPAENIANFTKPIHGLWGSPADSLNSWKKWCDENNYKECREEQCFYFRIKGFNVYEVNSLDDFEALPLRKASGGWEGYFIDYEALKEESISAVEVNFNEVNDNLGTYDCDSIIVLDAYDLVENYDARISSNPLTYNKLCPYRWLKTIGNIEISYSKKTPNENIYIYCEEPDSYYGFKTIIACISDGRIIETCGYTESEAMKIIQEVMKSKEEIIYLLEMDKIKE